MMKDFLRTWTFHGKVNPEKALLGLCLSVALGAAALVYFGDIFSGDANRQVALDSPGLSGNYFTGARTVGDFLLELGIDFSACDRIEPPPSTPVRPGLVVYYAPAKRVLLADAGQPAAEVMCPGETVCDLLNQLGLEISPLDRVVPPPSTQLEDGMQVEITRVEVLDITTESQIQPTLRVEPDPNLPRGHMEEIDPGTPGLAEGITRYYYRNGEETARVNMGNRVVVPPQERVARVGVRAMPPLASRGGVERDGFVMVATAYDPGVGSCGASADGRTATGHVATRGVCAVDPRVIPLGTELWVEGYGYALACDTGGAIHGNRIDVCFDTRAEALRWGRRSVWVYVLN